MMSYPTKILLLLTITVCSFTHLNAQNANLSEKLPAFQSKENKWVDSVYGQLSLEEKIGQLFMVAAYSGTEKYNEAIITKLIKRYKIGGLIFMQGTPAKQAQLTNRYQSMSKVPLFIGMDAEWGLGMRLRGIKDLPKQMILGATRDEKLMFNYGQYVASQCQRLGVHVNFAPVIDVNNNPKNPVINFRSFGEDKRLVAKMGIAYMNGLQKNGVMACAKHFPGHGDTDVDSHKDLPQINKSKAALKALELYPFQELFSAGIQSIMIAHLNIPSLEPEKNLPTTLSKKVVTDLLQNEMRYNGLIFTDALNMKGVTKYYKAGEVDYKAFVAGNDVLLFSENVSMGIAKIKQAVQNGEISNKRLALSVKKILKAKYRAHLYEFEPIETAHINEDINELTAIYRKQVADKGITLLSDPNNVLSKVSKSPRSNIAYLFIGETENNVAKNILKKNGIQHFFFAKNPSSQKITTTVNKLKKYDAVLVGIHKLNRYPKNFYGLSYGERQLIKSLAQNKNNLNLVFGNPYSIKGYKSQSAYLVCYNNYPETVSVAMDILFKNKRAKGKLPVSINNTFQYGNGITKSTNPSSNQVIVFDKDDEFAKRWRKKQDVPNTSNIQDKIIQCCMDPKDVNADVNYLNKIDRLIQSAISQQAIPGCRVLAAKDGKVFYDKSFGYQTYNKKKAISQNTVYDLASVTKVAATTLAVMKLYEEGKINLDGTIGQYLPWTRRSNKKNVRVKNLLLHQGGLKAWIPFYKETIDDNSYPKKNIYSKTPSNLYNKKVIGGLYMSKRWEDTMWKRILESPLVNVGRYKYSDLDFIFLQKIVERVARMPLDEYVYKNFYTPLHMNNTVFNPRSKNISLPIAPSEYDNYFRHKKVQGYVHDMGAAMFGGVSGHAGLFSTANDLSVLMQLLLNGGTYGGKRYLKASTIKLFTAKNSFVSRRGLGFDKPQPNKNKAQPTSSNCSLATFGHTGFTGTCIWADPKHNIQFILLSNRTYPTMENKKFIRLDVREKAQYYIYKSLGITSR